jgi:two-component system, OmpR family, response regulator
MRLLLLEDDARLAELLRRGLQAEGHAVDLAATIEDGRWLATENPYDVLVFDVMLPDGDGFSLCAELRRAGNWAPVLMLTARDAVVDRVRGLDVGADDYVVKPFEFAELTARLRALARRGAPERPTILEAGTLTIDPAARTVEVDGRPLSLSPREYALLELFVRRAGDVLTRTEIIDRVWDWAYDGTSNVVDVYVRYLRTKLADHPSAPRIETARGVGYVLRAQEPSRTTHVPRRRPHRRGRAPDDSAAASGSPEAAAAPGATTLPRPPDAP